MKNDCRVFLLAFVAICTVFALGGWAASTDETPQPDAGSGKLKNEQISISGRYARFERMLTQMADILARQDPERADLLRRALGQGRENLLREKIEQAVGLIDDGDLGAASEKQQEIVDNLQALLSLMQSEDRRSSVEKERERLNDVLRDVRQVMERQKAARISTQLSPAPAEAAPGQQQTLDDAQKLLDKIDAHDAEKNAAEQSGKDSEAGNSGEPAESNGDGKEESGSEDGADDPQKPADAGGKPTPENENGSEDESESRDPAGADGQQQEGDPANAQSQQGQPQNSSQTPGRKQLEQARQQMQQALEALQQQQREQALKNEDQALKELRAAEERLEEELRQLREEEKEMILASLEARFQRLLIVQTQIHESSVSLAEVPKPEWLDLSFARCRELAQEQTELARECTGTVLLLREDGTSSAILLAVEDIEADMVSVAEWLREADVSELTQSVQQDIIDALKQLIEIMQKELQEQQQQQEEQQQQQGQQAQQSPLVELIAEIRVLRNLQLQLNNRTERIDQLIQNAGAERIDDLRRQVQQLSERQQKLLQAALELQKRAESQ